MITNGNITDDEWADHIMNGEAFMAVGLQAAVAGQIGNVQLFNDPAAIVPVRVRLLLLEVFPIPGFGINTNPRPHDVGLVPRPRCHRRLHRAT